MRGSRPVTPQRSLVRLAARAAVAALALAPPPAAADSIRCEGGLVSVGDTRLDLLGKCGRPALAEPRTEERGGAVFGLRSGLLASQAAVVTVETWTYDFGPRRFVQYVKLEGGRVTAVERGGYGHDLGSSDAGQAFIPRARCDHLSIHEGDRSFDLLARCGEPATRDVTLVTRQVAIQGGAPATPARGEGRTRRDGGRHDGPRRDDGRRGGDAPILFQTLARTVPVEVWAYDFGPQVLVRLVELEDGVVTRVDTGSHGYSR